MKVLFAIVLLSMLSCSDNNHVKRTDIVRIVEATIPDTSILSEPIQIKAKAGATNGCWEKLHFELSKTNDFEFSLKAFGTFESYGACPAVMVYNDTLIAFKPTEKGVYLFYITEKPFKINVDTLVVK